MPAGYQDLFLEQGTTFNTSITIDDSYGSPYDLTNFIVKSQAKRSYYSANAVIQFTASVTDANNGIVTLSANSSITANLSPGKLVYDVILIDPSSNNVSRILEGQIFVSPAVTSVSY